MKFSDGTGQVMTLDRPLARLEGRWGAEQIGGWLVSRSHAGQLRESDLSHRLSEAADLAGDPDSTEDVCFVWGTGLREMGGPGLLTRATTTHGDGWQSLLVCRDSAVEDDLLQSLAQSDLFFAGGHAGAEWMVVLDRLPALAPPVRVLSNLPATMSGGLNPFLSAVGAEPVAVMDSLDPLLEKLRSRGPGCVAVVSRAGAFLWTLDLRGREGLECLDCVRIDEDVVLPLSAAGAPGDHVSLVSHCSTLLQRAREGSLDVAFVMNAPDRELLHLCEERSEVAGHSVCLGTPWVFELFHS